MDAITGLPDRRELVATLSEMLHEREHPTLFAVAIDGYRDLESTRGDDAKSALREVGSRLSLLVRSNDMLAVLSPGVFAFAGSGVEVTDTKVVLDRIRGVFAMPVDVGGDAVSFPITVGIAHSGPATTAGEMIDSAESDLRRQLGQ